MKKIICALAMVIAVKAYADTPSFSTAENQVLCICDKSFNCGVYVNPENKSTFHISADEQDTTFPMPPHDNCALLQAQWIATNLVRITKNIPKNNLSSVDYVDPTVPLDNHVDQEFAYSTSPMISASIAQDEKNNFVFNIINYALPNGAIQIIQPESNHPEKTIQIQQATISEANGDPILNVEFYNDQKQLKTLSTPIDLQTINQRVNAVTVLNMNTTPDALNDQESYAYGKKGDMHDLGSYGWHISGFSMVNDNWATQTDDCGSPCRGDDFVRFEPYSLTSYQNDNDYSLSHDVILYDGYVPKQNTNAEVVSRISDPTKAVLVPLPNTDNTYGASGVFGSGEDGFSDVIDDQGVHITYTDDDNKIHHVFVSYQQLDQAHYNPNQ